MSEDLGKGDVVAAVSDMSVSPLFTQHGPYHIKAGTRATVVEIVHCGSSCTECGPRADLIGLSLAEYPLGRGVYWCPCEWKKVGGGKDEHVAQFAHHLKSARPFRSLIPEKVG